MRTLAIDFGARRIGLALSDEGAKFATPLVVITVTTLVVATAEIVAVARKEGARRLVVGLPLNMDGSIGSAALDIAKWARDLSKQANLPLLFIDERLSSFAAEQQLNERKRQGEKLTRGRRKEQLDAIAAAAFLQDFLDGILKPIDLPT